MSLNSDCARELFSSSSNLVLHSGNIASWSKLRKKGVLTSTDELVSATEASFKSWLGRQNEETESKNDRIFVRNSALCQKISDTERPNFIFTLKVYLSRWGKGVREAVETTLTELGLSGVETLIVSFPVCPPEDLTLDRMRPVWEEVESLVRGGVVKDVGTADLDKDQFEELYLWASVKPRINQVNLAHCCTMPEDLVVFSKVQDIRLMTHNDDKDILPQSQLQATLDSTLSGRVNHTHWSPLWVVKYSSIIKLRGIISHKGYLVNMSTRGSEI